MKTLKSIIQHTDYGVDRRVVKYGNKILGYMEPYPQYTACDEEKGKWFYALGKPSDNPTTYRCNTEDEARNTLYTIIESQVNPKCMEDVLEDESLSNTPFDNRGDYMN